MYLVPRGSQSLVRGVWNDGMRGGDEKWKSWNIVYLCSKTVGIPCTNRIVIHSLESTERRGTLKSKYRNGFNRRSYPD